MHEIEIYYQLKGENDIIFNTILQEIYNNL